MSQVAKVMFNMCLAVAAITLGATVVVAQTADGKTPAVEDVCDGESGAAFGLCNAYCEAMDCDLGFDENPKPHASLKACESVRNNFMKLTARDLPCEAPLCPPDDLGLDCPCKVGFKDHCGQGLVCDEDDRVCVEVGGA